MTTVIVGLGSVGTRHQQVLRELGHETVSVSRRAGVGDFDSIDKALGSVDPAYVVIATETDQHELGLRDLQRCGYGGIVCVEKPIGFIDPELVHNFRSVRVGYNLRFHPLILELRARLAGARVLTVQARAGQHIEQWRPDRAARDTASNGPGGGVLRDLSHELDLLEWLVGASTELVAHGGQLADLGLQVDDAWACLVRYERCNIASVELNYLDRTPQRFLHMTTSEHTYRCDLIEGTLTVDGVQVSHVPQSLDQTYVDMHRDILKGENGAIACTAEEGFRIMSVVDSIERSVTRRAWMSIESP